MGRGELSVLIIEVFIKHVEVVERSYSWPHFSLLSFDHEYQVKENPD